MKQELIDLLVCPEDHSRLVLADRGTVERINHLIAAGKLHNRAGQVVAESVQGALVRADGKLAYPVVEEIPRMLIDEAIPLDQITS